MNLGKTSKARRAQGWKEGAAFASILLASCVALPGSAQEGRDTEGWIVQRFDDNPIITPQMLSCGDPNINGPSLIRAPDWLKNAPGRYLLYFSHHEADHMHLAYADSLAGPWKIHPSGVIGTKDLSWNTDHIASPDVLVDEKARQIRLYFHTRPLPDTLQGPWNDVERAKLTGRPQTSYLATSTDGLDFKVRPEPLGASYFRVWKWRDHYYALPRAASPLLRSKDGISGFTPAKAGPFDRNVVFKSIRHTAVKVDGDQLTVFYTRLGDAPEHIMAARVAMTPDWESWSADQPVSVLRPQESYEGATLPFTPSRNGKVTGPENALRDPAIYQESGRTYLLYSVQGERGIAIAELKPAGAASATR